MQAAIGEDQRLQVALQEFLGHARTLADIPAPDAQIAVDDRRIVKNKELLARRRAIFVDGCEFGLRQARRQLARIRDGCRTGDELRLRAIKSRYASQPAQHIREMAAEDAAVSV